MKKTIVVNINGIIFNIDDDAYEMLETYLDKLKQYFHPNPEGYEIITDIEGRIAELLQPRISSTKQTIGLGDVTEMIEILGKPEDIAGEENTSSNTSRLKDETQKAKPRLYRDPDHAMAGGVCSGLGAYFNLDPVIFRIVFIGLCFAGGISCIIYPILWIAVPKAKTVAQKLEMRGENVTIENIERTFREEYEEVKNNFSRININPARAKIRSLINEFTTLFLRVFSVIWHIIRNLVGIFLIVFSTTLIIAVITTFYFSTIMLHGLCLDNFNSLQDVLHHLINPLNADFLLIMALLIISIPLAVLIYAGLKLIIRFKAKTKWVLLTVFLLWTLLLLIFITSASIEINNFKEGAKSKETVVFARPMSNKLYINTSEVSGTNWELRMKLAHTNMFGITTSETHRQIFGVASINIEHSLNNRIEIETEKEARGTNTDTALLLANKINLNYSLKDSLLYIDPTFLVPFHQKWNFQKAIVTIRLPAGMQFYLNANVAPLLNYIGNTNDYETDTLLKRSLYFQDNGKLLLKKENKELH